MKELLALREVYTKGKLLRRTAPVDDDFPRAMHEFDRALNQAENLFGSHDDLDVNHLAKVQFNWVERMGWHNKSVLEALALISSEVGEAVNECRGEEPTEKLGEELADILLRTLDLSVTTGFDIRDELQKKIAKNEINGTRGRKI